MTIAEVVLIGIGVVLLIGGSAFAALAGGTGGFYYAKYRFMRRLASDMNKERRQSDDEQ